MRMLMCPYGLSHQTDGSGSLRGSIRIKHLIFDSWLLSALRWGFQRDYMPQREGMHCLLFTWQSHSLTHIHTHTHSLTHIHTHTLTHSHLHAAPTDLCTHSSLHMHNSYKHLFLNSFHVSHAFAHISNVSALLCHVLCLAAWALIGGCVWNRLYIYTISFCIWPKQFVMEFCTWALMYIYDQLKLSLPSKYFWEVST